MQIINNTILINGGSAGMGFEMAKLFSEHNTVIITGRDKDRLDQAVSHLGNVVGILCDVTQEADVEALSNRIFKEFPGLNVMINNAGKGNIYNLLEENVNAFQKAGEEMTTNYLSVIRLNEKFLPLLKRQSASAIINVTSIAVFGPRIQLTTYGASKAALHAYTQALRLLLEDTSVRVFELFPPLVNTDFTKDFGGNQGMPPDAVAAQMLQAFGEDIYEVYVGQAAELHTAYFSKNREGFLALNGR